jgi:hypothetical protein
MKFPVTSQTRDRVIFLDVESDGYLSTTSYETYYPLVRSPVTRIQQLVG